jgi:hypothetical protein
MMIVMALRAWMPRLLQGCKTPRTFAQGPIKASDPSG